MFGRQRIESSNADPGMYHWHQIVVDVVRADGMGSRRVSFHVLGFYSVVVAASEAIGDEVFQSAKDASDRIGREMRRVPYPTGPLADAAQDRWEMEGVADWVS